MSGDKMREAFIRSMKERHPNPHARPSLRQHGSGPQCGFSSAYVQERWMVFQDGWRSCEAAERPATPLTPEQPKPIAVVTGTFAGRFVVEPLNRALVLTPGMALYAAPQKREGEQDDPNKAVLKQAVTPLTPEQVEALAKRHSTAYTHRTDPTHTAYAFAPHALMDFVREIEAHCLGGGK